MWYLSISYICHFLFEQLVFRIWILFSFFSWHAPILCYLISTYFISPYQLLFVGDWMTPTPSHRAHPFHRGERAITVLSISWTYLTFPRHLIWSSFQYLILTYILVTYFSIHACLAWNQFFSSYPTSYIAVGWGLDDAHPFPGPTHSTGGRGVDGYDHDHGRGVGGEPGTWNIYICRHIHIHLYTV